MDDDHGSRRVGLAISPPSNSAGCLGTGVRQSLHGHIVRVDSQLASSLSGFGARREHDVGDALVADLAPPHLRGASFGLRQSLDTVGAFAGPIVAIAAMGLLANDIRAVFWIAVIPAIVSVAILVAFVNEPDRRADAGPRRVPLRLADIKTLSTASRHSALPTGAS
jgi:hypothetical protein